MKKALVALAVIAMTCSAFSQSTTTNEVGQVLIAADAPKLVLWDYTPQEPNVSFTLWSGTSRLATFSPSNYVVLGITNGVSTYQATNTFLQGTNHLALTVIGPIAGESDQSQKLPLKALGKPLPPSAPRTR